MIIRIRGITAQRACKHRDIMFRGCWCGMWSNKEFERMYSPPPLKVIKTIFSK